MSRNVGAYDSLIPMPKDGEPGKDSLSLLVGSPLFAIPVDAEDNTTLSELLHFSDVKLLQGGHVVNLVDTATSTLTATVDNPAGGTTVQVSTGLVDGTSFMVRVYVPKGQSLSSQSTAVTLTLTHKTIGTAYGRIQLVYVQRGPIGPEGKSIPQPYSCGWWDANTDYVVKNNYAPLVAYPKTANPLFYVRTENDLKYSTDGKPLDPATDYATYSGKGAWLLFEKYAAVLVDMLMANWARFGSSEGGVFWEHYLFSALGIPRGGHSAVDYAVYADSETPIFDMVTRRITGAFVPNLFLDFKTGSAKLGKLSESFVHLRNTDVEQDKTPMYRIDMDSCHNVAHEAIFRPGSHYTDNYKPCVVLLPSSYDAGGTWTEDGTHCTVLHEYAYSYPLADTYDRIRNAALVVCSDSRFLDPTKLMDTTGGNNQSSMDGWILWRGRRCKFVFLAPGSILKLRSCISRDDQGNESTVWIVENSGDFELLHIRITCHSDYYGSQDVSFPITNDTEGTEDKTGLGWVIGSPSFNEFPDSSGYNTDWLLDASGGVLDETGWKKPYIWHK